MVTLTACYPLDFQGLKGWSTPAGSYRPQGAAVHTHVMPLRYTVFVLACTRPSFFGVLVLACIWPGFIILGAMKFPLREPLVKFILVVKLACPRP